MYFPLVHYRVPTTQHTPTSMNRRLMHTRETTTWISHTKHFHCEAGGVEGTQTHTQQLLILAA